jgi:hypothetical protein
VESEIVDYVGQGSYSYNGLIWHFSTYDRGFAYPDSQPNNLRRLLLMENAEPVAEHFRLLFRAGTPVTVVGSTHNLARLTGTECSLSAFPVILLSSILPVVRPNKASPWTDCAFVRLNGNLRFSEKRQETSMK